MNILRLSTLSLFISILVITFLPFFAFADPPTDAVGRVTPVEVVNDSLTVDGEISISQQPITLSELASTIFGGEGPAPGPLTSIIDTDIPFNGVLYGVDVFVAEQDAAGNAICSASVLIFDSNEGLFGASTRGIATLHNSPGGSESQYFPMPIPVDMRDNNILFHWFLTQIGIGGSGRCSASVTVSATTN